MFGGPNAIEIVKSIEDIEASFLKHLEALHPHNLKYDILDVKNTEWHEDHNAFKTSLRHLEVMTNNVIRSACAVDGLPNVSAGVELLEAFQSMAKRESIKILLDTMTANLYRMFMDELAAVRKEFDTFKRDPQIHHGFPKHAGAALWAKGLHARISRQMETLSARPEQNPRPALCGAYS